jgi:hypothetical protein
MLGTKDVNRHPVVHTWSYKLAEAAYYDSNQGNAELGPAMRAGGQRLTASSPTHETDKR